MGPLEVVRYPAIWCPGGSSNLGHMQRLWHDIQFRDGAGARARKWEADIKQRAGRKVNEHIANSRYVESPSSSACKQEESADKWPRGSGAIRPKHAAPDHCPPEAHVP